MMIYENFVSMKTFKMRCSVGHTGRNVKEVSNFKLRDITDHLQELHFFFLFPVFTDIGLDLISH